MRSHLIVLFILVSLVGCKSPRFAKGGVFVEDVDRYFNTDLSHANVWLYMDIKPFEKENSGLKTNQLYMEDRMVLSSIGFRFRGTRILFSAVPESSPKYHLIAIHHSSDKMAKLEGYQKKVYEDAYYLEKDFIKDRLDIRHVYIPYGDKGGVSLIYYISTENHLNCRFCKIDYLARINALELQHNNGNNLSWQISECRSGEQKKDVILKPRLDLLVTRQNVFLKVYLDFQNGNIGLQYFQILKPDGREKIDLGLCPGTYYLEYLDEKNNIVYEDSIKVVN